MSEAQLLISINNGKMTDKGHGDPIFSGTTQAIHNVRLDVKWNLIILDRSKNFQRKIPN